MNLKRYYTNDCHGFIIIIDLKSVSAILFNKTSIDFCIYGNNWNVSVEVTKDIIDELTRNWTSAREEK